MNAKNLFRIAKKGWTEIRGNKDLLLPLLFIPALLAIVLPLLLTLISPASGGREAFLGTMDSMIKPFLLIVPTMVVMIIAADSIAGEKERKTIESFLVLPLTDREILVGKALGVLIPSLAASWISFIVMGLMLNIVGRPSLGNYIAIFGDASWWLLQSLLVTFLSFISTLLMVLISAKVRNMKAAQQYSVLVVLPIIGMIISGLSQVFLIDVSGIFILSCILGTMALGLTKVTTRHLNREKLILALD